MKIRRKIFNSVEKNSFQERGGMLVELLLSIALMAIMMPFVFRYQYDTVRRTENIAITRKMEGVQSALERYIIDNRDDLLKVVGKTIIRIEPEKLADYGISPDVIENEKDRYQLRVLKSSDTNGKATLQGVVVYNSDDISALRTREIISLGGGSMGFIEGNKAYGSFGAWHTNTADLGVNTTGGIVETTAVNRDVDLYLWRAPSKNPDDATMRSALNLGGHDILKASFIDSKFLQLDENLISPVIAAKNAIFQNRTTIDGVFEALNATVSGILSSDSRNLEITNTLKLDGRGKFSSFTTGDLWVNNLTLAGLSIDSDVAAATLRINKSIDMTEGRIDAVQVSVGFAGSITPRLSVRDRIEDSINPNYYWDAYAGVGNFMDLTLAELGRLAQLAVYVENDKSTTATQIFGAVAANKNATASDYMNAIVEIQKKVSEKYRRLNLE